VNDLNAHPFQFGNITGAHNGTLTQSTWKALEEASGVTTTVDSAAIFACINAIGIKDTINLMEKGRTSKDGAWALVWHDSEDNTINFLRNEHRPLWMAYSKGYKKLLWASEWPMLQAATRLSASEYLVETDKQGYGYWEVPEDTWLKWDLKTLSEGSEDRPRPVSKILKGKEPPPVASYSGNVAPFMPGTTHYPSKTTTTGSSSLAQEHTTFIELTATFDSPMAGAVDRETFAGITKGGCHWCHAPVEYDDTGLVVDTVNDYVLCKDCNNLPLHSENRVYVTVTELLEMRKKLAA
jgi:hypothetical protein